MKQKDKKILEITAEEERYKNAIIINYILNKNSHSIQDGGADNEGLWRDLEEYENNRNINRREQWKNFMKDKRCKKCGFDDSRALQWHHLDQLCQSDHVIVIMSE
jgi:predicted Zn-ribbon and HTH transcriptional regulator